AAIAREGFVRFDAALRRAGEGLAPESRLVAMGRAYVGFALDNPQLFGLMFSPEVSKDANPTLMEAAQAAYGALSDLAAAEGMPDRQTPVATWALVHGLSV